LASWITLELGGHTESGPSTWGEVPKVKVVAPAAKDDHGHAQEPGNTGHDH